MFGGAICQQDHFEVRSFHSVGQEPAIAKSAPDFSTHQGDDPGLRIVFPGRDEGEVNRASLGTLEPRDGPRQIRLPGMHRDGRRIGVGDGQHTVAYVRLVLRASG